MVHIFGQPVAAIKRELDATHKEHPSCKVLLYSNSKSNAETTLTITAESVLESNNICDAVIALKGDSDIVMEMFLMAAFCGLLGNLINLMCMPCTPADNCGVISHECFYAFQYSLPLHMIDLMQEMGRVNCGHNTKPGVHCYECLFVV